MGGAVKRKYSDKYKAWVQLDDNGVEIPPPVINVPPPPTQVMAVIPPPMGEPTAPKAK